jgi:hypothetical protein
MEIVVFLKGSDMPAGGGPRHSLCHLALTAVSTRSVRAPGGIRARRVGGEPARRGDSRPATPGNLWQYLGNQQETVVFLEVSDMPAGGGPRHSLCHLALTAVSTRPVRASGGIRARRVGGEPRRRGDSRPATPGNLWQYLGNQQETVVFLEVSDMPAGGGPRQDLCHLALTAVSTRSVRAPGGIRARRVGGEPARRGDSRPAAQPVH